MPKVTFTSDNPIHPADCMHCQRHDLGTLCGHCADGGCRHPYKVRVTLSAEDAAMARDGEAWARVYFPAPPEGR